MKRIKDITNWMKCKKPTTPGIPRRSPIQVLTGPYAAWLRWSDENRYIQHGMVVGEIILKVALFKFENPKWRHRCFPTMLSRMEFDSALAQCGIIFRNRSHLLGLEQTDNGSRRSSISRSIKYSFHDVIIYGRACATALGNGLYVWLINTLLEMPYNMLPLYIYIVKQNVHVKWMKFINKFQYIWRERRGRGWASGGIIDSCYYEVSSVKDSFSSTFIFRQPNAFPS